MSQCLTAFCGILVKPINLVLQHTLCPSSPILQRPSKCRFNFISLWISPERVKACKKKLKKLVTQLYSHVGWVTSFFFFICLTLSCVVLLYAGLWNLIFCRTPEVSDPCRIWLDCNAVGDHILRVHFHFSRTWLQWLNSKTTPPRCMRTLSKTICSTPAASKVFCHRYLGIYCIYFLVFYCWVFIYF